MGLFVIIINLHPLFGTPWSAWQNQVWDMPFLVVQLLHHVAVDVVATVERKRLASRISSQIKNSTINVITPSDLVAFQWSRVGLRQSYH